MTAISLWQPHVSLIITGAKIFETRHWPTKVRGSILLHAAQRRVKSEMAEYLADPEYQGGLRPLLGSPLDFDPPRGGAVEIKDLAFGAFIGIADLVNCIPCAQMTPSQRARGRGFGDFSDGRFAWEFENVRRFSCPIPAKGRQGFFYGSYDAGETILIPVKPWFIA